MGSLSAQGPPRLGVAQHIKGTPGRRAGGPSSTGVERGVENRRISPGERDSTEVRGGASRTRRAISPHRRVFVFHRLATGPIAAPRPRVRVPAPHPLNVLSPRPHTHPRTRPAALRGLGVGAPLRLRRPHRAALGGRAVRRGSRGPRRGPLRRGRRPVDPPRPGDPRGGGEPGPRRLPRRRGQHPRRRLHGAGERPRAGDRRPLPRPPGRFLDGRSRGPRARPRRRRRPPPGGPADGARAAGGSSWPTTSAAAPS